MTLVDTVLCFFCGYNYCDGECVSGCLQWCFILFVYALCKMGYDD